MAPGFGVGRAVAPGVGCEALLLGLAVGEPDEEDGSKASGDFAVDGAACCGPSSNDDIQSTNAPIPAQMTSRLSIDMSGLPPTYHYTAPPFVIQVVTRNQSVTGLARTTLSDGSAAGANRVALSGG